MNDLPEVSAIAGQADAEQVQAESSSQRWQLGGKNVYLDQQVYENYLAYRSKPYH